MPVNAENIKDALSKFEEDDFLGAKDDLKKEIRAAVFDYVQKKTELKEPIDPEVQTTETE